MVSHDDIRRIALALPGAIERASYGGRSSWRTKTKMFAWIRERPEALVVRLGCVGEQEAADLIVESWRRRAPKTDVAAFDVLAGGLRPRGGGT